MHQLPEIKIKLQLAKNKKTKKEKGVLVIILAV